MKRLCVMIVHRINSVDGLSGADVSPERFSHMPQKGPSELSSSCGVREAGDRAAQARIARKAAKVSRQSPSESVFTIGLLRLCGPQYIYT